LHHVLLRAGAIPPRWELTLKGCKLVHLSLSSHLRPSLLHWQHGLSLTLEWSLAPCSYKGRSYTPRWKLTFKCCKLVPLSLSSHLRPSLLDWQHGLSVTLEWSLIPCSYKGRSYTPRWKLTFKCCKLVRLSLSSHLRPSLLHWQHV
jgi:DNA-binding XRE family transcriptional regulator